jgi:hypothetical protein
LPALILLNSLSFVFFVMSDQSPIWSPLKGDAKITYKRSSKADKKQSNPSSPLRPSSLSLDIKRLAVTFAGMDTGPYDLQSLIFGVNLPPAATMSTPSSVPSLDACLTLQLPAGFAASAHQTLEGEICKYGLFL